MKLPRRTFLHLAATAAALPAVPRFAGAQAYPSRPVRIVVGFASGGNSDILARLIGQWLSERLGQPFVIENRPGAASNIGTEAVAKAPPDGYTLLLVSLSNAVSALLYDKVNFDFVRDIAPAASMARSPYVMLINPAVPAQTVPELIGYAKANAGKVSIASAGSGSGPHICGELLKAMAGVNMVHVPYRGDVPALTDLIGGQVQVYFGTLAASIEYVKAGKVRALAVSTATRSDALPDIPTLAEFVPGYEVSLWTGLGAPRGTPAEIVARLNEEINAGLADRSIKARLADLGATVYASSAAAFGQLMADETEKWRRVIRAANIKAE
ncbi:MAG TPA: tripartite tricarboxylate transporter substrate binding protein [Gemmataceae bacterium]|nr:tripartite tricarboxylate transporter substrate binding protein [Gemmataceae bacterium]